MKVLHVVNSLAMGGLENFVVELTKNLPQVDHYVACLTGKGELFDDIDGCAYFLDVPKKTSIRTFYSLWKLMSDLKVDIVHTHNQGPQFYGAIAAKLRGLPVVHTKHGRNLSNFGKRKYLDRISSLFTDKIVTVSEDIRRLCVEQLRIPEKKVSVILNGIDTNKFCSQVRPARQESEPFIIGTVARLSPEKNQACLLRAAKVLKDNQLNFKVQIVGDGPLKENLNALSMQLVLEKHVEFLGLRRDIPEILNHFDLFVLPSFTEGISLTLLEAMSCQLPVVATRVGGNCEIIDDGKDGFLVPSDDHLELANVLSGCISDEKKYLLDEVGKQSRLKIISQFSLDIVVGRYLSLYQSLAGSHAEL